jgi:hypothetical protein
VIKREKRVTEREMKTDGNRKKKTRRNADK